MKRDPISRRELPRIIHQIRERGLFRATRGGRLVEIEAGEKTLFAQQINFGICINHQWYRDQAQTVAAAVDEINRKIHNTGTL